MRMFVIDKNYFTAAHESVILLSLDVRFYDLHLISTHFFRCCFISVSTSVTLVERMDVDRLAAPVFRLK